MADSTHTTRVRFWLWLIRVIGVIVPRRLRADWRQEWEAELRYREMLLADHPLEIIGVTPANFFGLEVGRSFDLARASAREREIAVRQARSCFRAV